VPLDSPDAALIRSPNRVGSVGSVGPGELAAEAVGMQRGWACRKDGKEQCWRGCMGVLLLFSERGLLKLLCMQQGWHGTVHVVHVWASDIEQ
jgi:hypothetical protein